YQYLNAILHANFIHPTLNKKAKENEKNYKIIIIEIPCDIMTFLKLQATRADVDNIIEIAYTTITKEFYIEGVSPSRYVIVDDLICSGDTIKHIIGSIHFDTPRAKCIGAYFYLGEECAFNASNSKCFEKQFGTIILNPYAA
ncbi:MAG: hypothetical protein EBT86_11990, partial [Actinobacteria bacterium]|nr:hypothetical protein [Actinomycetota bacterium]